MTDSPFKPPGRIGAAGESAQPQRPGMVPTPPVAPQQRKRGAIPGGATLARPMRPANVDSETREDQTATNRWAYNYAGNAAAGVQRGDEDGGFEHLPPFKPAIELAEPRPLTVLFYQDLQVAQIPTEPIDQNFNGMYSFDDTAQNESGLAANRFRLSETGTDQPDSAFIFFARREEWEDSPVDFLERASAAKVRISYGASSIYWAIEKWELVTGTPGAIKLRVNHLESTINETDGPIDDAQSVGLAFDGLRIPNASVRARVRYRSGPSDTVFDCDWAGGFQVYAERLEIQRIPFAPDVNNPFSDAAVAISATVQADAPRPGGSLSLTVIPVRVPQLDGTRFYSFPVHSMARRVCLMLKYGASEDLPGDAPLGQIFLAFVGKSGRSLCYIDAMSAREALFGAGLPIPAGTSQLVVSNRSEDDTMLIGLIWRLEL